MNNKISSIIIITLFSLVISGDIGGYSIFEYNDNAFEINRVYFQYTDDLADDLFLKIRYDVGREGVDADGKFVAYLKNAYVDWSCKNGGLLSLGLIGTNSYGTQENTWGYRFIEKSPLDKYQFTNTADLGIGYSHSFGNLNINAQILNGEGYKSEESDNHMATYLRVMYGEGNLNKNDGYNAGLVITSFEGDSADDLDDVNLVGLFGGWASNNLRLGLEYNQYEAYFESGEPDVENQTLTSIYANYSISETLNIFARSDRRFMMFDIPDLNNFDVTTSWIGMVYNPSKGLYISPNIMIEDGTNDYRLTFMFKY